MIGRVLPVVLVLGAVVAEARGANAAASYFAVAAVPAAAVAVLALFGDLVEAPARAPGENALRAETALSAVALALVLGAALARGEAADGLPTAAVSALVGALGLYAAGAVVALTKPTPARAEPVLET